MTTRQEAVTRRGDAPPDEVLRAAYRETFGTPAAAIVLKDLKRFCRGGTSTFSLDHATMALLEGRREVFLRITEVGNVE